LRALNAGCRRMTSKSARHQTAVNHVSHWPFHSRTVLTKWDIFITVQRTAENPPQRDPD